MIYESVKGPIITLIVVGVILAAGYSLPINREFFVSRRKCE